MKLLTAVLLLLVLVICFTSVEGSKCKCLRKGPKIRFSDIQKLEERPKYPYCKERMIIISSTISSLLYSVRLYRSLMMADDILLKRCYNFGKIPEQSRMPYIVTMKSRFRGGHQYCLHPKLPSTKRLLKWYTIWKEKERVYEE